MFEEEVAKINQAANQEIGGVKIAEYVFLIIKKILRNVNLKKNAVYLDEKFFTNPAEQMGK